MKIRSICLFLVLFILSNSTSAQDFSIRIPSMSDQMEPEMFFCEPHYDANNKVVKYTIGNILQMIYSFDEQNRYVEKSSYMWTKYSHEWIKQNKTFYTYDKNHIKEEKNIYWPSNYKEFAKVSDTISAYRTVHFYNDDYSIDTMMIYASPINGMFSLHADTTMAISYLNSNGKPDSSIISRKAFLNFKLKKVYTYDHQKRCVKTDFFNIIDNKAPEKATTLTIDHDKHKTTYTWSVKKQRLKYDSDDVDEQDKSMLEGDNSEENKEKYIYTISYDENGRITGQHLLKDKAVILDNRYRYDNKGRTIVVHEQEMENEIFSGAKYIKYTIDYDKDDVQLSSYYIRKEDSSVTKIADMQLSYSPEGLLLWVYETKYTEDEGLFKEAIKTENKYNDRGLLIERVKYEKSFPDSELLPAEKQIYDYDENGNVTLDEKYEIIYEDKGWLGENKEISKYDGQNQLIYSHRFEWDEGKWIDQIKEYKTYTPYGRTSSTQSYYWNRQQSPEQWIGSKRDSTVYDNKGNISVYTIYEWDCNKEEWKLQRKEEHTYTDTSERIESCFWTENKWVPNDSQLFIKDKGLFDSSGLDWDEENQKWREIERKKIYTLNDSLEVDENYLWDNDLNMLKGSSRTISLIEPYMNNDRRMRIECRWDTDKKCWIENIRYTNQIDSSSISVYELYNEKEDRWENYNKIVEFSYTDKEMYMWQGNRWIPYKRTEKLDDDEDIYYQKISLWNEVDNKWEPYCYRKSEKEDDDYYIFYYIWNKTDKKWEDRYRYIADTLKYYDNKNNLWISPPKSKVIDFVDLFEFENLLEYRTTKNSDKE